MVALTGDMVSSAALAELSAPGLYRQGSALNLADMSTTYRDKRFDQGVVIFDPCNLAFRPLVDSGQTDR